MAHYLQPYLSVLNPKSAILQSAGEVCLAQQHMFLMSPQSLHGESFVETLKVVLRTSITIRSLKLVNRFLAINIPGVKCNLHAKYQLCEFSNLVAHWDQRKPASHSDLSKYTIYLILEYNIYYKQKTWTIMHCTISSPSSQPPLSLLFIPHFSSFFRHQWRVWLACH